MPPGDATFAAAIGDALLEFTDDAIYATDLSGTVTSWNAAAERLFAFGREEAVGRRISDVLNFERADEERAIVDAILGGDVIRDVDAVRCHRDGRRIPVVLSVFPVRDGSGATVGAIRVVRDASGRVRGERAARRLAAIVESSDDAIVSKDLNGTIMSWNKAAERIFGYAAEEIVGESIRKIIPPDRQCEEDEVLSRLRRGERIDHFETIRQRKDGTLVPISLTVSPVLAGDGRVVGASKIARDISDRKQAEVERERLLAMAEENAAIAEKLNRVGAAVASGLDRDAIVQAVTDTATDLTAAQVGAFFYNVTDAAGETCTLYTISGPLKEQFQRVPVPRNTAAFEPMPGGGIVRSADITAPRSDDGSEPYHALLPSQLPVRSYLAVPVRSRSGGVLGGLFFGHARVGVFTEQHERLAAGIASWAAVALENARLYSEAQEASRLKDEFLATLSHELRTPLNAILGYSRMIRGGIVAPENHAKAVAAIERNAASLAQIVEDVLDVSRIISGKLRLNVQPIELADIVRHAVEAVMPAADAKSIRVETHLDVLAGQVSGDADRLQQVFWNLLSNAVKFTPRGGRVHVSLSGQGDNVELAVRDTGIGIAKAFLPHIFERFRQQDSGTTRERGGLGLGLGIARQLVEMHGGTIEAESEGPNCGSTFRVALPVLAAGGDHLGAARDVPQSPLRRLNGVRVLVVDDDPDALAMVKEILEAAGANVAVAASAGAALDVVGAVRPDVLVADLAMPRVDGFELIARLRRATDDAIRNVPAAALTAHARSEDRAKALRSGFQMHLAKPIDPVQLTAAVAELAHRPGG